MAQKQIEKGDAYWVGCIVMYRKRTKAGNYIWTPMVCTNIAVKVSPDGYFIATITLTAPDGTIEEEFPTSDVRLPELNETLMWHVGRAEE